MRVRVSDPEAVAAVIGFFAERGCVAEELERGLLDVFCLSSTRHDRVASELDELRRLWERDHPGVQLSVAPVVGLRRR
jgi:hypothetical protein